MDIDIQVGEYEVSRFRCLKQAGRYRAFNFVWSLIIGSHIDEEEIWYCISVMDGNEICNKIIRTLLSDIMDNGDIV